MAQESFGDASPNTFTFEPCSKTEGYSKAPEGSRILAQLHDGRSGFLASRAPLSHLKHRIARAAWAEAEQAFLNEKKQWKKSKKR